MSTTTPISPFLVPINRVRCSDLAQFASCPKRAKIQAYKAGDSVVLNYPMQRGNEMHFEYSCPYKSFDRRLLRYKLDELTHVFTRQVDNLVVAGIPDDYRVLLDHRNSPLKKIVSIIEVKTTSHKRIFTNERETAIFQLQLYIWLMEPWLKKLGYQMHTRHYVEFYSQKDGRLLKRIIVGQHYDIENRIRHIMRAWQGLEGIRYPEEYVCRRCPKNIKSQCSYWKDIHGDN